MIKAHIKEIIKKADDDGISRRAIAKILKIDIKTIRSICKEENGVTKKYRKNKKIINYDLLAKLYERCNGYKERVHEVLKDEYQINIGYSTLTRLLREYGLGSPELKRCEQYPDVPGEEMQHDTTIYSIIIGNKKRTVVCSGIYLRYSKLRYIKFYFRFNRFRMKCFLHEALTFWGYLAKICIIDNTNLAVHSGSGYKAVFSEEMKRFAKNYGFKWKAHQIGHANRKAGKERNFYTIETNFLPGRTFKNLEDLNNQGFKWATDKWAKRPMKKTKLVPLTLFENEKPELIKLPKLIEPPYQSYQRLLDQYGYIEFASNYYYIPDKVNGEKIRQRQVNVIEYAQTVKFYQNNQCLITHKKAGDDIYNQKFTPEGIKKRFYEPKNIKKSCDEEEKVLRNVDNICILYIDFIRSGDCKLKQIPGFIRKLYYLYKKLSPSLFLKTIARALEYKIDNIESIERISYQLLKNDSQFLTDISFVEDYQNRTSFQEGRFSNEISPSKYQEMINDNLKNSES